MRKLGWLLKRITALARECGGKATVKYDVKGDKLVIVRDEGQKMLPEDLYAKWQVGDHGAEAALGDTVSGDVGVATLGKGAGSKNEDKSAAFKLKETWNGKETPRSAAKSAA